MKKSSSVFAKSEDYKRFKSLVCLQRVCVNTFTDKEWVYYDFGPKENTPLICLPGITGTPDVFYKQILCLAAKGYRIISLESPAYMTHERWIKGFDRFLDFLKIGKIHLLGTTIGGYMAQCYLQYRPSRVLSLVLCNTFCDTQAFADNAPCAAFFTWMPEFVLKRMLLSNFPTSAVEAEIANSIDFVVEQLETVSQKELAAKMTLNCTSGPLKPEKIKIENSTVTIIDTVDDVAIPTKLREDVYKFYPSAKLAFLKTGGNFPYLSRSEEFNLYLEVHLRNNNYFGDKDRDDNNNNTAEEQNNTNQPVELKSFNNTNVEEDKGLFDEKKEMEEKTIEDAITNETSAVNNNTNITSDDSVEKND
jgi:maspardin